MKFTPYAQTFVDDIRAGGPDAYGRVAEEAISSGTGTPCRSCLKNVPKGDTMLILAARPFRTLHPYAETGPIFFCKAPCMPYADDGTPDILSRSPEFLVKAYSADDRILYGTGRITPKDEITDYARTLFDREDVTYIDVRSARNNCFLTRIIRDT
ncbi:DUF1203 domain-containing protein [Litoreibacter roseus]|uniref:DUF1203 domain-containing protein n=1 Tax=Litoreibacter roseus TaxID=2601869 RepID=A0A6N6JFG6_9RHOB|nr:DUF1203 domain-containing protein [Litoreibacter roseus]GFE64028.1 hypothetical protein KIN_11020 [Litoreibacter roseus]